MIRAFACADTEAVFVSRAVSRSRNVERFARRKLLRIAAATELASLRLPPAAFPLPFPFLRACAEADTARQGTGAAPFVVGAMMTAGYASLAERLLQSCEKLGVAAAVFEVATVHRSISCKGTEELACTKANFIHFLLDRYSLPVLYIDVDCYLAQFPNRIPALIGKGVDFAIYNWLTDEANTAYLPIGIEADSAGGPRRARSHVYRYSHSVDFYAPAQLMCSGAAQFYNDTGAARELLRRWHTVVAAAPRSADDQCLDFAFNNFAAEIPGLACFWWDRAYVRYPWWIDTRPVIDHPDIPSFGEGFEPIDGLEGRQRYYLQRAQAHPARGAFPRDCLIDTQRKILLRLRQGQFVPAGSVQGELWL